MTPEEELELIELEQELRRRKPKVTPEVQAERDRSRANAERAKADLVEEDGMWVSKSEKERGFGNKVLGFAQGLTGSAVPTLFALNSALPTGRTHRALEEALPESLQGSLFGNETDKDFLPGESVDTGQGMFQDLRATYLKERDRMLARDAQAQEETPGYFAAEGLGTLAQGLIPVGGAGTTAKAGMLTREAIKAGTRTGAIQAGVQGGVQGALSADNAEQGSFMSLADTVKDAAVPALFGLGLGGLAGAGAGYLGAKVMNKGPFSRRGMDVSDVDTVPTPMGARVKQVGQIVRGTGKGDFLGLRGLAGDALESLGSRMERGRTSHIFAEDVDPTNMTRPPVEADVSNYQMPKATYVEDAADILSRDGDVMKLTPDELTAYNTGNKVEADPNDFVDSNAVTQVKRQGDIIPANKLRDMSEADLQALKSKWKQGLPDDPNPIFQSDNLDADGFDGGIAGSQVKSVADRPSAKAKQLDSDKSVADRPSAKKQISLSEKKPEPELEGPKTDPEKSGIRELKNLAEFRNEFRGQTKDMAPEDIVDAFPPEKRVAVAEAGKAFALGGEKFLKAFDGNEVEAARYALDNGLVQSVDDLVKALNMKGSGSRMDAKNIAKELGYPDLPTVAPGSSRARKKATSEKLKKKKGP